MAFERYKFAHSYDALEPHIDAATMQVHSEKHHQGYTDKLNAALEGTEWADKSIEEILKNLDSIPEDKRTVVRNNGGGFFNHNLFFSTLTPNFSEPSGEILEEINSAFGSLDKLKEEMTAAATNQFGSGWAWLGVKENGTDLHIHAMPNQDNPLMHGHLPVLGIDVWEHAYYLKYQNKRPDYIAAWWNLIDWNKVNENLLNYRK